MRCVQEGVHAGGGIRRAKLTPGLAARPLSWQPCLSATRAAQRRFHGHMLAPPLLPALALFPGCPTQNAATAAGSVMTILQVRREQDR